MTAHILFESLGSIRDIKLTASEDHFRRAFVNTGERAKGHAWVSEILPIIPRMLIEPLGITLIFLLGAVPPLLRGDRSDMLAMLPFMASLSVANAASQTIMNASNEHASFCPRARALSTSRSMMQFFKLKSRCKSAFASANVSPFLRVGCSAATF